MKKLTRKYQRECLRSTDHKGSTLVVTLLPGDILDFRSRDRRTHFQTTLQSCYNLAMIQHSVEDYQSRMKEYQNKRDAGIKCRKPTQPGRVYSQEFYQALKF